MKEHGFKPVKRNKPSFDEETQTLIVSDFEEVEDSVIVNYTIVEKQQTLSNRVSSLENLFTSWIFNSDRV